MNTENLKSALYALWKDTFHDSDEYVSLIFDNYFDADLCEFEEADGEIVAGMIGIPYDFGSSDNHIRALYLCGLATKPSYRSRGIMTGMLSRINSKARERGFAFTFLIPSDEGLRKYYHDRGYVNAFYRVVDNYTSLHDFDLEYDSILAEQKEKVAPLKKRYYDSLKQGCINATGPGEESVLQAIADLISGLERSQIDLQVIHSAKDIELLLKEYTLGGGCIFHVSNPAGQITAAAFATKNEDGINIHKLYSTDLASKYKVLGAVKRHFPEFSIHLYVSSIEMDRNALWTRTYGSFLPEAPGAGAISITERVYSLAAHAKVYGMARVLNLYEILKFQAALRNDLKYSILMKSPEDGFVEMIETGKGEVKIKKLPIDSVDSRKLAYLMSERDISEILFRRRDTDNLITEAFGIPSINGSICLMLD